MNIADIKIGDRHRKDLGDLGGLADSINTEGLLQPIGLTPDHELVFGYRRLIACRDRLGWAEIDVRIVNVTSIVAGEYAENEMRKNFTVSERVAILETIERRSKGGDRKSKEYSPLIINREQAARLAGLGNTTTARQATLVVDHGTPELIAAMDRGQISIEPAAILANESAAEQNSVVALPVAERRQRINAHAQRQKTERKQRKTSPKTKRQTRINPPFRGLRSPQPEEVLRPSSDAPLKERQAFIEKYGRVILHPTKITDLLREQVGVEDFVLAVTNLVSPRHPALDVFIDSIDHMSAHVVKRGKDNGEQIDFAKTARQALQRLDRDLDLAIERLTTLRALLMQRAIVSNEAVAQ